MWYLIATRLYAKSVHKIRRCRDSSFPTRRNATSPIHPLPIRRFAPQGCDTTQADDSQNRLPELSIYD